MGDAELSIPYVLVEAAVDEDPADGVGACGEVVALHYHGMFLSWKPGLRLRIWLVR